MKLKEFFENGDKYFLPNLSIDIVVMGYDGQLKCLLMKNNNRWNIPGGYIGKSESINEASNRILNNLTGLQVDNLKLLSLFGDANRNFGDQFRVLAEENGIKWDPNCWLNSRFVSIIKYVLVNIEEVIVKGNDFYDEINWIAIDDLVDMNLDHQEIINTTLSQLRIEISDGRTCHEMLPNQFTMPDLHQLHQVILQKKIDRSRFQKKMIANGKFLRLPKTKTDSPGRNPFLYTPI